MAESAFLWVHGLRFAYPECVVLDNLSLAWPPGLALVRGDESTGKTTLLRALAGLDAIDGGVMEAPARPAVVFQEHRLLPWDSLWRNVALGLPAGEATRQSALRALAEVGLGERADDWPRNLSGGQAQRVALARALVQDPRLLLLDEATVGLDMPARRFLVEHVHQLVRNEGLAVLWATHLIDEVLADDQVALLHQGRLVAQGRASDLPQQAGCTSLGQWFDQLTGKENSACLWP